MEQLIGRHTSRKMDVEIDHRDVVPADVNDFAVDVVDHGRSSDVERQIIGKRANANAVIGGARTVVMALEGKGAVVKKALLFAAFGDDGRRGFDVIDNELIVEADLHVFAAHRDVETKGFLVGHELLIDITQTVEGGGAFAFEVATVAERGVVDLNFKALFREARFLIGGVEVDALITAGLGGELNGELEIAEVGSADRTVVEEVGAGTVGGECAVDDLPGIFIFAGLPAGKRVAVE